MRSFVNGRRAPWARRARALLALLALSCGGPPVAPYAPAADDEAERLYWSLRLNHEAITLSTVPPYDEIQLVATPHDAHGVALPVAGDVTFTSADPKRLEVTPDGWLRAHAAGTNITVTVTLTIGNVRHTRRMAVTVTDVEEPPVVASIAIAPLPPDSTLWSVTGDPVNLSIGSNGLASGFPGRVLLSRVADGDGNPVFGIAVSYTTTDSTIAGALGFGSLAIMSPWAMGEAGIVATATAYGVTVTDTAMFTITAPAASVVRIVSRPANGGTATVPAFESHEALVVPGGTVIWTNVSGHPVDIVFDDPANVVEHGTASCAMAPGVVDAGGSGDIAAFGVPQPQDAGATLLADNCRSRRFLVAGVYPYRSTLTGATGRVVVTSDVPGS